MQNDIITLDEIDSTLKEYYPASSLERYTKKDPYKSIHYNIRKPDSFGIEIQLCTLIDDISNQVNRLYTYKQRNTNSNLQQSINVLYDQLIGVNSILNFTKTLHKEESINSDYTTKKLYISDFLFIEDRQIMNTISRIINTPDIIDRYEREFMTDLTNINEENVLQLTKTYNNFIKAAQSSLTPSHYEQNPSIKRMALKHSIIIKLLQSKHYEASDLANESILIYPNDFIFYFLQGEAFIAHNNYENAFLAFDTSLQIYLKTGAPNPLCLFALYSKLAYIHYQLVEMHAHSALSNILNAYEIFNSNKQAFNEKKILNLLNNACYYSLSAYEYTHRLNNQNARNYLEQAHEYYLMLQNALKDQQPPNNIADTIAWFCFLYHKNGGDKSYLEKAKIYAKSLFKIISKQSSSTNETHSFHARKILSST